MSIHRLEARLAAALLAIGTLGASPARADMLAISEDDRLAYEAARHFKALAASLAPDSAPLVRYTFNYDTPGDALRAALASCEEARSQAADAARRTQCAPVLIGPFPVTDAGSDQVKAITSRYLEESISVLTQRLRETDDRATRTTLETILHKSGRYAESEALLTDLAASGEALARNALAYHWAERNIHLDQALAYAESAVAAEPDMASFHDTQALVLFRLGRFDAAVVEVERAVALEPHPIIEDHEGDLLWAAGRCAEAAAAWRRAMADSPDILLRQRVEAKLRAGPAGPPVFD